MPLIQVDKLIENERALKSRLAEQGDKLAPAERRALKKRLRRVQRKRRTRSARMAQAAPEKSGGESES